MEFKTIIVIVNLNKLFRYKITGGVRDGKIVLELSYPLDNLIGGRIIQEYHYPNTLNCIPHYLLVHNLPIPLFYF